jgi:putative copper resistance protein D
VDEALIVCRFLQFAALMLLFGGSAFTVVLAPPALRQRLLSSLSWPIAATAAVTVVTALLWLGLEAGEISGSWGDVLSPGAVGPVLTATSFGQVWILRLVLTALLLPLPMLRGRARGGAMLILSTLLLGSLAFVGHAAMRDGTIGWMQRLNQAVHLLAAGFWLGCLPLLLVCLLRLGEPRRDVTLALRRFSGAGHAAVALVLATGIVNTALILGKPPLDFASPYQALLLVKIGLVATMIAVALVNRYLVVPRLPSKGDAARRWLVAGTVGEIAIGAVVIGLVSAFATFDPV